MEKYYQDYAYHLRLAAYWYTQIGKYKLAQPRHEAHLNWANQILKDFKALNYMGESLAG